MDLVDCEPVYEEFDGFTEDITNCRSFDELPATVRGEGGFGSTGR